MAVGTCVYSVRKASQWAVNSGMCDIHRGGHLRVEGKECVAVCGEHFVCDGLVLCVVRPVALCKEVLAGHVAESRSPVAFVAGVRTVVGHELRVVLVVHAPSIGVVDEGVGGLGGSNAAHGTGVLSAAGATHEGLDEAFRRVVEGAGLAVDGVDEGHLTHVVHLGHIAGAEVRLAPTLVVAVVTVLQQHGAAVDGIHDLCSGTACPSTEFGRRGRNVAQSVGTKIVDHHIGVLVARPLVTRITAIDGIDTHGILALVAPIAAHHFRADLEPALCLPA